MPADFPLTIGQDLAGEVAERGNGVDSFRVYERVPGFAQGAYAEYITAPVSTVAPIPEPVDFVSAAALPTAGSTARQIIPDVIEALPGMTILIQVRRAVWVRLLLRSLRIWTLTSSAQLMVMTSTISSRSALMT